MPISWQSYFVEMHLYKKNAETDSGAIITINWNLSITSGSLFHENMAESVSGIILSVNSTIIVRNSNFTKNTLSLTIYPYSVGGGIYLVYGSITLFNYSFINNSATLGGVIAAGFGMIKILYGYLFYDNKAIMSGGVIYSASSIILINESKLNNVGGLNGTDSCCIVTTVS